MRYLFIVFFSLFFIPHIANAAPLDSYEISITDGVFQPASIEVPANKRFKIIVKNTGTTPVEFENLSLRVEKVLSPGAQSFVVIHPLKPGSYHFIDDFHLDMAGFEIISKEE